MSPLAEHTNDQVALAARIKLQAKEAGFTLVGITSAEDFQETEETIRKRLHQGLMDGLPWYHEARVRRGCKPGDLLSGARSIIALAISYDTQTPPKPVDGSLRGRISRYAWGKDYHGVFEKRVKQFLPVLKSLGGEGHAFYVDYGPMPDRAVAQRAGLGWYGKNTNILTSRQGSWVFLAEVLTTLDLAHDRPLKKSCGKCTTCIPACPTNAIVAPYVIDMKRCISYQTIENRGPIPLEMRPLMGDWVFGCDICQDVCPVNSKAKKTSDEAFIAKSASSAWPDLVSLLTLTQEEFERRFRGTAARRAKRTGLQRNACIALGNLGNREAVPALANALTAGEALVRGHAAWALGRLGGSEADGALRNAALVEQDNWVRQEIADALA